MVFRGLKFESDVEIGQKVKAVTVQKGIDIRIGAVKNIPAR